MHRADIKGGTAGTARRPVSPNVKPAAHSAPNVKPAAHSVPNWGHLPLAGEKLAAHSAVQLRVKRSVHHEQR
jgi:hypothetical protein